MMNSDRQMVASLPSGAPRGSSGRAARGSIRHDGGTVAADGYAVECMSGAAPVEIPAGLAGGSDATALPGKAITFQWPDAQLSQNGRGSWQKRARLVKEARTGAARLAWDHGLSPMSDLRPVRVVFHPPPRGTRDKTNMIALFKAVEDGIADALAVNDATFDPAYDVGPKVKGGAIVVLFSEIPAT